MNTLTPEGKRARLAHYQQVLVDIKFERPDIEAKQADRRRKPVTRATA